jgi:hypothetical protein
MLARNALVVVLLLLAGCIESETFAPRPAQCPEPRPATCAQVQQPVCGVTAVGAKKSYSNSCMACGDKDVVGYRSGGC